MIVLAVGLILLVFCYKVWDKKRLIKAVLIQLSDEMTRTEHLIVEIRTAKMDEVMNRYVLQGKVAVNEAKKGILLIDEDHDLLNAATTITEFYKVEFGKFLYQVQTLRFILDAVDALIGDNKSLEVAWTKGIRYLERYYTELIKKEPIYLPWILTFPKLLGLPFNINRQFVKGLINANSKRLPHGFLTLFIASRLFDYTSDLKYGVMIVKDGKNKWIEKYGDDAWKHMLSYKAWHHHRVDIMNLENRRSTV